jgi:hypothetical protein
MGQGGEVSVAARIGTLPGKARNLPGLFPVAPALLCPLSMSPWKSALASLPRTALFSLGLLAGAAALAACSSTTVTPTGTGGSGGAGGSGGGGDGGMGGQKPVTCTWAAKTSNAVCAAGACPIALDQELRCDDDEFAAPGVRVAPAPDATWLATSSSNDRQVYRIAGGKAEKQDGVPKEYLRTMIALALGPDGAVHLASDTTSQPDYKGGVVYSSYAAGAWTSSVAFDNPEKYTSVLDLEMTKDNTPLLWVLTDAPNTYSLLTPKPAGGWAVAAAPVPEAGAWNRFTRGSDGSIVSLAFKQTAGGGEQLHALVGAADRSIGAPSSDFSAPDYVLAAAPAPGAPNELLFTLAMLYGDGIHVFGESASAPEKEVTIPGIKAPVATCHPPDPMSCTGATCHETAVGLERGSFALAWTDEGVAYLAYVITSFDQDITYSLQGDPGIEDCWGNVASDKSTATLHLVRVAFDGSAPKEVLTMPVDRPGGSDAFSDLNSSVRVLDARAFGHDLAIGLRTGWVGQPHAVRLLRLDTSAL